MEIKFLEIKEEDSQAILDMMADFNAIDNYPFDRQKCLENLNILIRDKQIGRIWMIQSDDAPAGYIVLTFGFSFEYKGRMAMIDEFYIIEKYRNLGIGLKTMEFIHATATELGVNTILLEVENQNEKAKRLYFKQGYSGKDRSLLTKCLKNS
ncbi:MAG: GNAT family N-acetyltransferase [Bacteroidales bacterium]|nr:GNAT family N-acetyltransferase [Bacteroidales bacterium]